MSIELQALRDNMPGRMHLAPESSCLDAEYAKGWNECLAEVLKVLDGGQASVATIADATRQERALIDRLRETFDPGGTLPDDCWEWATPHEAAIDELEKLIVDRV